MAACQFCISVISLFTLEHSTAANSKNFSTGELSTFDKSTSADSSDNEIDEMVREATKKKAQRKERSTKKTATEETLAFRMEPFNYQKEQDQKFEKMLCGAFEQQRKINTKRS